MLRPTFLLMTRLSNHELVLGKLFASLLDVFVMLLAGLPVFMLMTLFGGISLEQVLRVSAVTLTCPSTVPTSSSISRVEVRLTVSSTLSTFLTENPECVADKV